MGSSGEGKATECILTLDKLAALRGEPVQAPALPQACAPVSEIVSPRQRSREWFRHLKEAFSQGTYLDQLLAVWLRARAGDRASLRLLCSLLDVRYSGLELLHAMLRPSQMLRMCALRSNPERAVLHIVERAKQLASESGLPPTTVETSPQAALRHFESKAHEHLQQLMGPGLHTEGLQWLRQMVDLELQARSHRLEKLAERVGAYDARRISRILPFLSLQEERLRDTRDLIVQFPDTEALKHRTPVLGQILEKKDFEHLLLELRQRQGGQELAQTLALLWKHPPLPSDLFFGAAVLRSIDQHSRTAGQAGLDPARSLMLALHLGQDGAYLRVRLDERIRKHCAWLHKDLQLPLQDDVLGVRFVERLHSQFLSPDGIPELIREESRQSDDIRELVMANVQNESLLCGLLVTPRVASAPGLVESVVGRVRSVKVLLEIANRRELHTGFANRNVPAALLAHPTSIPLGALRKFVHVRYVGRLELSAMSNRGSRIRPEIRQMISSYLSTLVKT